MSKHAHYKTVCGPTEHNATIAITSSDIQAAVSLHAGEQKVSVQLVEERGVYKLEIDASGIELSSIKVALVADVADNIGDFYAEHFTLFGAL